MFYELKRTNAENVAHDDDDCFDMDTISSRVTTGSALVIILSSACQLIILGQLQNKYTLKYNPN